MDIESCESFDEIFQDALENIRAKEYGRGASREPWISKIMDLELIEFWVSLDPWVLRLRATILIYFSVWSYAELTLTLTLTLTRTKDLNEGKDNAIETKRTSLGARDCVDLVRTEISDKPSTLRLIILYYLRYCIAVEFVHCICTSWTFSNSYNPVRIFCLGLVLLITFAMLESPCLTAPRSNPLLNNTRDVTRTQWIPGPENQDRFSRSIRTGTLEPVGRIHAAIFVTVAGGTPGGFRGQQSLNRDKKKTMGYEGREKERVEREEATTWRERSARCARNKSVLIAARATILIVNGGINYDEQNAHCCA